MSNFPLYTSVLISETFVRTTTKSRLVSWHNMIEVPTQSVHANARDAAASDRRTLEAQHLLLLALLGSGTRNTARLLMPKKGTVRPQWGELLVLKITYFLFSGS